jgi:hypothetical protein
MNERHWNLCTKPKQMLRFLLGTNEPRIMDVEAFPACKVSDRKLRLFACTCHYRFRGLLTNPLAQAAVEVAEQFAAGVATSEELQQAHVRLQEALDTLEARWRGSRGAEHRTLEPKYYALVLALHLTRLQAPKLRITGLPPPTLSRPSPSTVQKRLIAAILRFEPLRSGPRPTFSVR